MLLNLLILVLSAVITTGAPHSICVYEDMKTLKCDWCPVDYETSLVLRAWRLDYTVLGLSTFPTPCSKRINSLTCTCVIHPVIAFMTYQMNITSAVSSKLNQLKISSKIIHVRTDLSIVQFGPVNNFSVTSLRSTNIRCAWKHPSQPGNIQVSLERRYLLYKLQLCSDLYTKVINTTTSEVDFTDLHPFTVYNISIYSYTYSNGIQGPPSKTLFSAVRTKMAGPAVGPTASTLTTRKYRDQLYLYWQEVPHHQQNGLVAYYNITYIDVNGVVIQTDVRSSIFTHIFNTVVDRVSIASVNVEDGVELSSPWTHVNDIKAQLVLPPISTYQAEVYHDALIILWRGAYQFQGNFYLFQCHVALDNYDICVSSPEIDLLDVTQGEDGLLTYHVNTYHPEKNYALISHSHDNRTSGVPAEWLSICYYNAKIIPFKSWIQKSGDNLLIAWEPSSCDRRKKHGRVENYTITITRMNGVYVRTFQWYVMVYNVTKLSTVKDITITACGRNNCYTTRHVAGDFTDITDSQDFMTYKIVFSITVLFIFVFIIFLKREYLLQFIRGKWQPYEIELPPEVTTDFEIDPSRDMFMKSHHKTDSSCDMCINNHHEDTDDTVNQTVMNTTMPCVNSSPKCVHHKQVNTLNSNTEYTEEKASTERGHIVRRQQ